MRSLLTCEGRRKWLPPLLWMGMIFLLSSQSKLPGPDNPFWDIVLKKAGHFIVYGTLAWLILRALCNKAITPSRLKLAWSLTALYAASDEFHQHFVPGRHATLRDWLIDMSGAFLFLWLVQRAPRFVPEESTAQ